MQRTHNHGISIGFELGPNASSARRASNEGKSARIKGFFWNTVIGQPPYDPGISRDPFINGILSDGMASASAKVNTAPLDQPTLYTGMVGVPKPIEHLDTRQAIEIDPAELQKLPGAAVEFLINKFQIQLESPPKL